MLGVFEVLVSVGMLEELELFEWELLSNLSIIRSRGCSLLS